MTERGPQKMNQNSSPGLVLLFSGKRKSGKDYLTAKLFERLGLTEAFSKI